MSPGSACKADQITPSRPLSAEDKIRFLLKHPFHLVAGPSSQGFARAIPLVPVYLGVASPARRDSDSSQIGCDIVEAHPARA
jgi:hypothetical protein